MMYNVNLSSPIHDVLRMITSDGVTLDVKPEKCVKLDSAVDSRKW